MNFDQVHAAELKQLRTARAGVATGEAMIGLAFSGGGIRSATFNLGILQGLAKRGLLKHIDYLSTVSGGGYIGAWYMAFLKRLAGGKPATAEDLLKPDHCLGSTVEPHAVLWLRRFSNYLTPKTGLSGDTLAMVATYLRNLLLNLTVFIAFIGCLLLLPRVLAWGIPFFQFWGCPPWLATLPLLFAVIVLVTLLFIRPEPDGISPYAPWWQSQTGILFLVVLPALVGSFFLPVELASSSYAAWSTMLSNELLQLLPWLNVLKLDNSFLAMLVVATLVYLLPWLAGSILIFRDTRAQALRAALTLGLTALSASMLAGLIFYWLAQLAQRTHPTIFELTVFGPPLVLLACMVPVGMHIGLARRYFTDMQREWSSRLGGWLLAVALVWLLVAAIALFGPIALGMLNDWVAASGGVAWLATTVWGILAGKGVNSGRPGQTGWRETLLRLVPWVFVLGLLCLLSLVLQKGLTEQVPSATEKAADAPHWSGQINMTVNGPEAKQYALSGSGTGQPAPTVKRNRRLDAAITQGAVPAKKVLLAELALLGVFFLFGWRIDINLFSLHNFYRNRLTRAYLGASRQTTVGSASGKAKRRQPDPFTGFDTEDDIPVSELGPRPYPLFNTSLNLVGGDELAWQQRKAAAFCIAPEHCGYQFPAALGIGPQTGGYGPTRIFLSGDFPFGGGIRLGTAMAISGAAVNPNMGFHSSPAVSFLLTLFNARLGRWVGNPADPVEWRMSSPAFGVGYLFLELFGLTSVHRAWFNLSDGGHFENLGIYELVRRRLPYIIVVDAAQDASYEFDDLANAIRKIRADFGIDIEIDLSGLRPRKEDGRQPAHVTVGRILYDPVDQRPGVLVYIRPGLTGKEPADVLSYAQKNPPFPYQSTGDQFFDEAQFESYRKLGLHIADSIFREATERVSTQIDDFNPEDFFTVLREVWRGHLNIDTNLTMAHQERLEALYERLRTDAKLSFLSVEFIREWPALMGKPASAMVLPASEEERKSGFYLCREIAQLMERMYQDLNLEDQYDHPDCRGWMNLFRRWSGSPMFRATYSIAAATLNEQFQRFCKRRLELDLGELELVSAELNDRSLAALNFVERKLVRQNIADKPNADTTFFKLVRFELAIRYPGENEEKIELLRFHFGFALLADHRLVGFRIQDHLRRMGLARQAMRKLLHENPGLHLDTTASAAKADQTVLLHLSESVEAILKAGAGNADTQ